MATTTLCVGNPVQSYTTSTREVQVRIIFAAEWDKIKWSRMQDDCRIQGKFKEKIKGITSFKISWLY